MQDFSIVKSHKIECSFRNESVKGMYDIIENEVIEKFNGNIDIDYNWNIGLIVGNSGTGKTTISKKLFGKDYFNKFNYNNKSILDNMPKDCDIKEICSIFNNVGFSSPTSWLKSYSILSNGEKMRVDLARLILEKRELIVYDEFTSVVDRNIAKMGSYALSKSIRKLNKKFIAVSCHFDITDWLQPDWVLYTNNMKFEKRRLLRQPKIEVNIFEKKGMWNLFRKYHYLNHDINNSSKQFIAYYNEIPIGFCAVLHQPHPRVKRLKRIHRLVILPDYQGIGIGKKLLDFVCQYFVDLQNRISIITSNPILNHVLKKDKKWKLKEYGRKKAHNGSIGKGWSSGNRITFTWEYINK